MLGTTMEIQPIPKHENAVSIRYEDSWHGDVYCPFCGMKSIGFVSGQLEAMPCPHIVFAEAHGEVLHIADVFIQLLKELVPSVTEEKAYGLGGIPWPNSDNDGLVNISTDSFCTIVPNSITIATFDSESGEEMTVTFAPVDVQKSARLDVKSVRRD